ncbi:MAG: hypothetical protein JOZ53_04825, partial [Planctomycetaceae bacterium]|nr:hypothetical protein [Planctomycetaceae bacterium]
GLFPRLFSESTRVGHPERVTWLRAAMEKTSPRGVVGALRGMAVRPDRTADLARITVPTLVMVGADDVLTPPDEVRKMAEALPPRQAGRHPQRRARLPLREPRRRERGHPPVPRRPALTVRASRRRALARDPGEARARGHAPRSFCPLLDRGRAVIMPARPDVLDVETPRMRRPEPDGGRAR